MKRAFPSIALGLLGLAGCMSTGIVTIDTDIHLVHKKSGQLLFGSPDDAVVSLYREAGEYCWSLGMVVETVALDKERTVLLSPGAATLKFRCVAPWAKPASAAAPSLPAPAR